MTTLKRGLIKSYNPGTHRASVQITGSLAVWLDTLPVATDIPPAEVLAGRECAVLFFTDDNPDDAVIVTVHGAAPTGPGKGSRIQDADNDTWIDVENTPDEDKVRVTAAAVLRTLIQTTAPQHTLYGDVEVQPVSSLTGFAVKASNNPRLTVINTAVGGKTFEVAADLSDAYWYNRTDGYYILRQSLSGRITELPGALIVGKHPTGFGYLRLSSVNAIEQNTGVTRIALDTTSPNVRLTGDVSVSAGLTVGAVDSPQDTLDVRGSTRATDLHQVYAAAFGTVLQSFVGAQPNPQVRIQHDRIEFGPGTSALDASLSRGGAGLHLNRDTSFGGRVETTVGLRTLRQATDPAPPPDLYCQVFARSGPASAAGRLRAIFDTGVVQTIAAPQRDQVAINGLNNDYDVDLATFVRITGPTLTFTITGIAGGQSGQHVTLYNATTQAMTIANEDINSAAANRIRTLTGAGQTTIGDGSATLIYDATAQRWILTAINGV